MVWAANVAPAAAAAAMKEGRGVFAYLVFRVQRSWSQKRSRLLGEATGDGYPEPPGVNCGEAWSCLFGCGCEEEPWANPTEAKEGNEDFSRAPLPARLAKDRLQLTQTPEQKERAATLLLASDSPAAFVRSCLVKKRDGELGVVDLYGHYQKWAKLNHVRPFSSRPFTSTAKEEIEIGLGMKLRHDLEGGNGKARRGWKGLALVEMADCGKLKSESMESAA